MGFLLLYLINCLHSFLSPEDIQIQDEIKMFLEQQSYLVVFGLHHDHATELEKKKAQVTEDENPVCPRPLWRLLLLLSLKKK